MPLKASMLGNTNDAKNNNEHGDQKETVQKLHRNHTIVESKIIELILFDKFITTTQMTIQIGKSRQTIATRIKELQERGVVKRKGPDKGGFWEFLQ